MTVKTSSPLTGSTQCHHDDWGWFESWVYPIISHYSWGLIQVASGFEFHENQWINEWINPTYPITGPMPQRPDARGGQLKTQPGLSAKSSAVKQVVRESLPLGGGLCTEAHECCLGLLSMS